MKRTIEMTAAEMNQRAKLVIGMAKAMSATNEDLIAVLVRCVYEACCESQSPKTCLATSGFQLIERAERAPDIGPWH